MDRAGPFCLGGATGRSLVGRQAIMFFVVDVMGLHYGIALTTAVAILPASTYLMSRIWAFSPESPARTAELHPRRTTGG